uniref:ABC transmembrane type-1 domain-containing protein n=1 Tax=Ditylenchus dipsaci TaxID=166011 RepID=A0A915EH34_9BILA
MQLSLAKKMIDKGIETMKEYNEGKIVTKDKDPEILVKKLDQQMQDFKSEVAKWMQTIDSDKETRLAVETMCSFIEEIKKDGIFEQEYGFKVESDREVSLEQPYVHVKKGTKKICWLVNEDAYFFAQSRLKSNGCATGKESLLPDSVDWTSKNSAKNSVKKKRRKDDHATFRKVSFLQLLVGALQVEEIFCWLVSEQFCYDNRLWTALIATVQGDVAQAFSQITAVWNQEQQQSGSPNDCLLKQSHQQCPHRLYLDQFHADIVRCCWFYFAFGCVICVSSTTQVLCFLKSGENVIRRLRMALFSSILRQEIAWFDENSSGMMTSKMFDDLERVREGTGDKVALLLQSTVQFISGYSIAFYYDWQMTIIMACLAPLMILTGAFMARLLATSAALESRNYAAAGAVAEQAISSIRTVTAFNGQEEECMRYEQALREGMKNGIRRAYYTGTGLSITFVVLYSSYALAFWMGTSFIADGQVSVQTVITVFFGVLLGSTALGSAGQHLAVIGVAQGAAAAVYAIIDRVPVPRKTSCAKGICPKVLENFSLEVKPGETYSYCYGTTCQKVDRYLLMAMILPLSTYNISDSLSV